MLNLVDWVNSNKRNFIAAKWTIIHVGTRKGVHTYTMGNKAKFDGSDRVHQQRNMSSQCDSL